MNLVAADQTLGRWLDRHRGRPLALTLALAGAFVAVAAIRLYPFIDDVATAPVVADDWFFYRRAAVSILHDGWTIPVVAEAYFRPGGFLYNYFVAAVFATFGENSTYVYLTQAGLLGSSIALMYLAFRRHLAAGGAIVYLVATIVFLTVDVFWKYTVRLLSENLLLFWLPLCHRAMLRALQRGRARDGLAAGLCLGLAASTRPNTLLLVPGMSALLAWRAPGPLARRLVAGAGLLVGAAGILAGLPLRDHAVTGHFSLRVLTDTQDWESPATGDGAGVGRRAWAIVGHYLRRALYCAGLLFIAGAKYPVMPHWLLMWTGVVGFAVARVRAGRLATWEMLAVCFVALYLGPLLAGAQLTNYGVRMIVPVVPTALLLAVEGAAVWSRSPRA